MSFAAFENQKIVELVERYCNPLTLIVGSGASVEAGLPNWNELIERLLRLVAERYLSDTLRSDDQVEGWIEETMREESLIGAAAIIQSFAGDQLEDLIVRALCGDGDMNAFLPRSISREVALLCHQLNSHLRVVTTNYDDMLEIALRETDEEGREVVACTRRPTGEFGLAEVVHLHGYAGREPLPCIFHQAWRPPGASYRSSQKARAV